jgi:LPS sulfotransferase NodH
MSHSFDYFVIFAEMRTGSNFLEVNLNAFERITSHGEAFNPHFIGYPNKTEILGITQTMRDHDPARLISAIKTKTDGLGGFRYFHDHDARVLDICVPDPTCAKIILTRNPADSYISWKIAQTTGQWKLNDAKRRKDGTAEFDADEFSTYLDQLQSFQINLQNRLQISGQTAFYLNYDDLQSVEVMNGLARFLGQHDHLEKLDKSLKKQNPSPLSEKVSNFADMEAALAQLDRFDLARTPSFEPRRGPVVPSYIVAAHAPLIYMPVRGGPETIVCDWLAALDHTEPDALATKLNQKDLRHWKRAHPGHRSFTVLRHPVARIHATFCERVLSTGAGSYTQIRQTLKQRYKLPLPQSETNPGYDLAAHRAAFMAFLDFVEANLAGQTAIRVDATWCTQDQAMQGFGEFVLPDFVFREDELEQSLSTLAKRLGYETAPQLGQATPDAPFPLQAIYDDEIESRIANIYQRDYMMFGFKPWSGDQAA